MTQVFTCQLISSIVTVCINLPSAGTDVTDLSYMECIFKNKAYQPAQKKKQQQNHTKKTTKNPKKHHGICHSILLQVSGKFSDTRLLTAASSVHPCFLLEFFCKVNAISSWQFPSGLLGSIIFCAAEVTTGYLEENQHGFFGDQRWAESL